MDEKSKTTAFASSRALGLCTVQARLVWKSSQKTHAMRPYTSIRHCDRLALLNVHESMSAMRKSSCIRFRGAR